MAAAATVHDHAKTTDGTDYNPSTKTTSRPNNTDPYSDTNHIKSHGCFVHFDIVYGSGTANDGYRCNLWFVDRRSKHIEKYLLKSLASDELLKYLRLFQRDMGGRFPDKMIGERNFKLIGGQVSAALEGINEDREEKHQSVVTGDPAGRKNQNDLPEIKWRQVMLMVHNWLTSNYLPWKFWYFALKMAAQVSNYMPIILENGQWNTLHEQKYGTKLDWRNLVPMLSIGYIRRNWDGNKQRVTSNSKSITGICVGNNPKSDGLLFYLPTTQKLVVSADYRMYPTVTYGPVFGYYYDGGIGFNLYNPSTNATRPPSYEKEEQIYFKTKEMQEYEKGKVHVNSWDNGELVTIQTHPSLDIVQVDPQYVNNINTEPHYHTTSSVVPHYSWVQPDIKVTLKLHGMPIPKQGFLIYDDDKWSFRSGRKKKAEKKLSPSQ